MVHDRENRGGGTPPKYLASLSNGSDHHHNGHSGSGSSLRGSHHNRVPDIPDRPFFTLLPSTTDGSHPEPYFMTPNVVLQAPTAAPPWMATQKAKEKGLSDFWRSNSRFQDLFVEEFIKDALYLEISGIAAGQHSEMQSDNKEEGRLHSWLQDHVITDEVYLLSEELVWETLWDEARKVSKADLEDLEAMYGSKSDQMSSSQMRILRDNYTRPIHSKEGQQLLDRDWGELVFHLNRLMQRGSLMENYAIKKLQEQIITQVAAKVVLDDALKFMEDEMANMDEEGRIENPPRQG